MRKDGRCEAGLEREEGQEKKKGVERWERWRGREWKCAKPKVVEGEGKSRKVLKNGRGEKGGGGGEMGDRWKGGEKGSVRGVGRNDREIK